LRSNRELSPVGLDDDPAVRMVVRRQLEYNGLRVYTAEGVREAKERIEQMPPDGLFIDIWLGDGTAFWVGHRSQREILSAWPLTNYPGVVAQSEAFFHSRGWLAVFLARFVAPIRAFVPITAGALGMPPLRFYAVNIPAILVWAPAHVLPGVLAVSALHEYVGLPHHEHMGKHLWMLAVAGGALIVALAIWTLRRRHGGGVIEPARPVK